MVVVQLSATPEPPTIAAATSELPTIAAVARAVLSGPDKCHKELPKPGPSIEDGAWPSFPPYKPVNTTQRVNEILRGFQEASAVHAANGAPAGPSVHFESKFTVPWCYFPSGMS